MTGRIGSANPPRQAGTHRQAYNREPTVEGPHFGRFSPEPQSDCRPMNPNDVVDFLYRTLVSNMSGMGLFFACLAGLVGSKRGRPFWAGFVLSIFVHWVPALMIMSILPPPNQRRRSPSESLDDFQREQRRITDAERRAQQVPAAAPSLDRGSRGSTAVSRAEAQRVAQREAPPPQTAPSLPPPAVDPLPVDLHPDPLADAPRVTLRGDGRSAKNQSSLSADGST